MKKTKISVALAFALGGLPVACANAGDAMDDPANARPAAASGTHPAGDTASAPRSDTSVTPDTGFTPDTSIAPDAGVAPGPGVTHSGLSGPGPTPNTANAVVNEEAAQDGPAAAAVSSQAQSRGLLADSHLDLLLRNYLDYSEVRDTGHRHAWVQAAMLDYESGFTKGLVGFGMDVSLYGAFKLDGGTGAGNMVHVARHGNGANQIAWAYPAIFNVKARVSETVIKYGQLRITDNPLVGGHDNRSLPPTLRGVTVTSNEFGNLSFEGGSFNGVRARGTSYLQKLSTAVGGTRFDRLTYVGANWRYAKDGTLSL
ncbi:MAG: OprD family outer membrane porin, partial [Janthinobacterium lividum]